MRKAILILLFVLAGFPAVAYKYHEYRWKSFPIVWYLDKQGYPLSNLTLQQLQEALQQAFHAWEEARYGDRCTSVRFVFGGYVDANGAQFDGKNVVSFALPGIYDNMPGVSETPGSLGKTVVLYDAQGYVREADIVFPVTQTKVFSVHPTKQQYDLIGIAMHQIGHMLGIDHSQVPQATMFGVWPPAGDTSWRTLEEDDKQAVVDLYPGPCAGGNGEEVISEGGEITEPLDASEGASPETGNSTGQITPGMGPGGGGQAEKWGCSTGTAPFTPGIGMILLLGILVLMVKRHET